MKSDILEVINNVPEPQRFHHSESIHHITTAPNIKNESKTLNKPIQKEEPSEYKDIPLTNIRKVKKKR